MLKMIGLFASFMMTTGAVYAGQITLGKLDVKSELKAGRPYTVSMSYTKSGDVKVKEGCFIWTWEGPYCFPVNVRSKTVRVKLRTNNPNSYKLIGFVRYLDGGKLKDSNRVSAQINVKR